MKGPKNLLVMALTIVVGLAAWYWIDRPSMLYSACAAGLPNYSRPSHIEPEELGCAILAPKATYKGLLLTGYRATNFSSPEFPAVPSEYGPEDTRSWFHCPVEGCGGMLDAQLGRDYLDDCLVDHRLHTGFATIEAEGWVTVSEGTFGRLNLFPRDFYAARIVTVSPPPDEVIREWKEGFRRNDRCG